MAVITTKFDVGDTVWHASLTTTKHQHKCPDCLGSGKWAAESPAGATFVVSCPRCTDIYMSNRSLSLNYAQWTPQVSKLTIGSVRANTVISGEAYDSGHQYMCLETGIGSGSIYREDDLFSTEEAARAQGEARAAVNNAEASGWVAKQYSETAKFSDYQLKDAAIEAAEGKRSAMAYSVQYLLEDLEGATSINEVKETIERWRARDAEAA